MNKFKDFLYDKNDIMVALVILIVAAVVIFFRINAIMDYPSTQTDQGGSGITETVFKS
jgi:multidrug resistance efflux pump